MTALEGQGNNSVLLLHSLSHQNVCAHCFQVSTVLAVVVSDLCKCQVLSRLHAISKQCMCVRHIFIATMQAVRPGQ